jgi:hypothetical protein
MHGTFGYELESYGLTIEQVSEAIKTALPHAEFVDNSHTHHGPTYFDGRTWQAMRDGSITGSPASWSHAGSHEIVSPVLKGRKGMNDLVKVAKALSNAGAQVDTSCGVHLTFGLDNSRWRRMGPRKVEAKLARLVETYNYFGEVINSMLPRSRRNNYYCTQNGLGASMRSKYSAVNLSKFASSGVVEFRQHAGSLNGKKLREWGNLMHALLRFVVNEEHAHKDASNYPATLQGMAACLELNEAQVAWWSRRIAQLNPRMVVA